MRHYYSKDTQKSQSDGRKYNALLLVWTLFVGAFVIDVTVAVGQGGTESTEYTVSKIPKNKPAADRQSAEPAATASTEAGTDTSNVVKTSGESIKLPPAKRAPVAVNPSTNDSGSGSDVSFGYDPGPATGAAPVYVGPSPAATIAVREMGEERAQEYIRGVEISAQKGGSWLFDGAVQRSDSVSDPDGTSFFGLGGERPVRVTGAAPEVDTTTSSQIIQTYEGIPGGVVLEGAANFEDITNLDYDAKFNALILNDTLVYFVRIPPSALATLARAITTDPVVGVSLGQTHIVYGVLPQESAVALDLKLVDSFLGDIVFAQNDRTRGYIFANGYKPKKEDVYQGSVAVFFNFNAFEFQVSNDRIINSASRLDVRIVPLLDAPSEKGDLLPDQDRIAAGDFPEAYRANARHIAENVDYYQRERLVAHTFDYGATAAFLRGLALQGFDLAVLANVIEAFG